MSIGAFTHVQGQPMPCHCRVRDDARAGKHRVRPSALPLDVLYTRVEDTRVPVNMMHCAMHTQCVLCTKYAHLHRRACLVLHRQHVSQCNSVQPGPASWRAARSACRKGPKCSAARASVSSSTAPSRSEWFYNESGRRSWVRPPRQRSSCLIRRRCAGPVADASQVNVHAYPPAVAGRSWRRWT